MSQAYTPGLEVTASTTVTKIRELPLPGKNLVNVGDTVRADTAVLSADLPGDLQIVRVAERLGLDPVDVLPGMQVAIGDSVSNGDLLCRASTFFGMFNSELHSPATGIVEFMTEVNAHLGIRLPSSPLTVSAYVAGKVISIDPGKSVSIETRGALIQGVFGVGGERLGEIYALEVANDQTVTEVDIRNRARELKNKIIIGGSNYEAAALKAAADVGASAIVTGSIDSVTLRDYVGFEIGVSITGDEDVPFTLIVTEGFGELALSERITELARALQGKPASVNGATQVRAGAMRPEIIVPSDLALSAADTAADAAAKSGALGEGSRVRMIRVPYFGKFGTVSELPHEPEVVPSGARVRVLRAMLDSGEEVTVPRANVELI